MLSVIISEGIHTRERPSQKQELIIPARGGFRGSQNMKTIIASSATREWQENQPADCSHWHAVGMIFLMAVILFGLKKLMDWAFARRK